MSGVFREGRGDDTAIVLRNVLCLNRVGQVQSSNDNLLKAWESG